MTLMAFLILLLIAGICGAIGQAITGFDLGGILVTIAVGFIGAVLGGWLARTLGLPRYPQPIPAASSIGMSLEPSPMAAVAERSMLRSRAR